MVRKIDSSPVLLNGGSVVLSGDSPRALTLLWTLPCASCLVVIRLRQSGPSSLPFRAGRTGAAFHRRDFMAVAVSQPETAPLAVKTALPESGMVRALGRSRFLAGTGLYYNHRNTPVIRCPRDES